MLFPPLITEVVLEPWQKHFVFCWVFSHSLQGEFVHKTKAGVCDNSLYSDQPDQKAPRMGEIVAGLTFSGGHASR